MTYRIAMNELGIAGDDTVIEGADPAQVIEEVVEHLRAQHDLDMPDAQEIMSEPAAVRWVPPQAEAGVPRERGALPVDPDDGNTDDPAVKLILTRLQEKLRLGLTGETDDGHGPERPAAA